MSNTRSLPAPASTSASLTSTTTEYLVAEAVRFWRSSSAGEGATDSSLRSLRVLGEDVGQALAELLSSRKKPPLSSQLEIIKWVCKEFWSACFSKPIDNLKTNHKGTYVLRDTSFRWTKRVSQNVYGGVERRPGSDVCMDYLALPEAMVKGALKAFGLDATVKAETAVPGQVDFTLVVVAVDAIEDGAGVAGGNTAKESKPEATGTASETAQG